MKIRHILFGLILVLAFLLPTHVLAAPQTQLNYQAQLMDRSGNLVSDGTYSVRFALYTQESDGDAIWSESRLVSVKSGVFSVMLGSETALNLDFTSSAYYLGTKIGSDSELSPRRRIGAAPFAVNSAYLDGAKAGTGANEVLKLGSVGEINIGGTITADSLISANNGFALMSGSLTLPTGIISTAMLADEAITTEKLADQSVTSDKLAADITFDDLHSINITNVSNIQTDTLNTTGLAEIDHFYAQNPSHVWGSIDTDGALFFVAQGQAADPSDERAVLKIATMGSSSDDWLIMGVFDDPIGGAVRAFTVDYAGNVYARGNISLEAGSTVDGVDVSSHKHNGNDGSSPIYMAKNVYIENPLVGPPPQLVDWFGFPTDVTVEYIDIAVEDQINGVEGDGFTVILTDQDSLDPSNPNDFACRLIIQSGETTARASSCGSSNDYPARVWGEGPVNRVFVKKDGEDFTGGTKANVTIWYKTR